MKHLTVNEGTLDACLCNLFTLFHCCRNVTLSFHCLSQTGCASPVWHNSIYIKFEFVWLFVGIPICVFLNDKCTGKIAKLYALAVESTVSCNIPENYMH